MTIRQAVGLAAPHTWAASVCPALYGIVICARLHLPLGLIRSALLLLAVILMQSAVNTLNDYVDYVKGTDSAGDVLEASDAVLVYTGLEPEYAKCLGIGYLAAGILSGGLACAGKGMLPVLIGFLGAVIVLLYSGGPLPVSYLPAGECVSGFVMGGLIPLGIAACTDGAFHGLVLAGALPLIIGIALVMMTNNGCDIEKDLAAGRKTLPVLLGREKTFFLYRCLIIMWLVLTVLLSCFLAGYFGIGSILILVPGRNVFRSLFQSGLKTEKRILLMKQIAMANVIAAFAYIGPIWVRTVWGIFYGG